MPQETRVLSFSAAELAEAVSGFAARTSRIAMHGPIREIAFPDVDPVSARVVFGPEATTELDAATLLELLIFYCVNNDIPLSTRAEKRLRLGRGRLELVMRLGSPSDAQFSAAAQGAAAREKLHGAPSRG